MINLLSSIFAHREKTPSMRVTGSITTADKAAAESQPSGASYQEKIVRVNRPELSLTVSAVYRAVELKAKTLGQMEMQYQRKSHEKGNYIQSMWGPGKKINYLLQKRANPIMTSSELFQHMSIHRELLGNAYVYIERDELGDPTALWLARCGGYNPLTATYALTYLTDRGIQSIDAAPARDVIHWRNTFKNLDGYMGIPTHCYALQTLSQIATAKQQSLETAAKGGRMKLIIGEGQQTNGGFQAISSGLYNKKAMQDYADEINDRIYEKDVVALRALDKVQNISMTAQDMQMAEMLNMSLDDVARYYATPRPLLMLDTNSHYSDYSNATMEYLQRTIAPLARELEDLFEAAFLTIDDFGERRFHLCELPLLRMDLERQAKVDEMRLQMGWTVNEIRAQYDMPAIEKGDIPYISTNLAELGSNKLSDNGTPAPAPAEPTPAPPKTGEEEE